VAFLRSCVGEPLKRSVSWLQGEIEMSVSKEPIWLIRILESFSNETEELVEESKLPHIELWKLQRLWNAPSSNAMIECFSIEPEQADFFSNLVKINFDFEARSYFMSAYTTDWEATQREGGYMGMFPPPRSLPSFSDARRVLPKAPANKRLERTRR